MINIQWPIFPISYQDRSLSRLKGFDFHITELSPLLKGVSIVALLFYIKAKLIQFSLQKYANTRHHNQYLPERVDNSVLCKEGIVIYTMFTFVFVFLFYFVIHPHQKSCEVLLLQGVFFLSVEWLSSSWKIPLVL